MKNNKLKECLLTGVLSVIACVIIYKFNILNPNIILFVILSAVLVKFGYRAGIVCGVIAFSYSAFFFSVDHSWIRFDQVNFDKLMVLGLGIIANIVIIGRLQKRTEQMILENAELEKKYLESIAYTDGLTKLGNRYAYEQERNRLEALAEIPVIVMVSDMNGLKQINDTLGHLEGDKAICRIGELLEKSFAEFAKCYRIGGDEFCVLAEGDDLNRFEASRREFIRSVDAQDPSSGEFGVATGVATGFSGEIDKVLREADQRMYACKKEMKGIK